MLGTFLQPDPIGSLDYINPYACVGLEPGNATDPTGMQAWSCAKTGALCDQTFTAERARAVRDSASLVADFTPILGHIKCLAEFISEPSLARGVAVALGLVPRLGDAAGKAAKELGNGIIFKRIDPDRGRCYIGQYKSPERFIGQCKSPERFTERQKEHNRAGGKTYRYQILDDNVTEDHLRPTEQR